MVLKLKLINENKRLGVEFTDIQLLKLIKICENRNKILYKKLVDDYEYLTQEKFNKEWIR